MCDLPELMTVDEAARYLRIGRTKAYAMTRQWRSSGGRLGLLPWRSATPCASLAHGSRRLEGGDASDFAHEATDLDGDGVLDEMTTAAHTGGANSGNLGLALLGEFTDHPRTGGEPKAAAVTALEDELAELGNRHSLDPTGEVLYVNPVNGDQRQVDTISGHRDWAATECPGDNLFGQLPTIRTNVAAKMAVPDDGSGGTGDTGGSTMHVATSTAGLPSPGTSGTPT